MDALKHWKIILSLTAIFVAGAVTGSVITFKVVRNVVKARTNPDLWSSRVLRDYKHRLKLTPEQIEHIRPLMMEANREMKMTRGDYLQAHGQLIRELHASLDQELTSEQRRVLDNIRNEQMRRFRERGMPPGKRPQPAFARPGMRPPGERPYWKRDDRPTERRRPDNERAKPRSLNSLGESEPRKTEEK